MKRWVLRILLLLTLGAIVNVVVAWGCAYGVAGNRIRSTEYLSAAQKVDFWARYAPSDFPATWPSDYVVTAPKYHRLGRTWATTTVENPKSLAIPASDGRAISRGEYGLPMRSMFGLVDAIGGGNNWNRRFYWYVNSPFPSHHQLFDRGKLPVGVIWPGFAINTVFYAAVLWLLFAAPFALRRRMRFKRGLCPKCAYPVGTNDVCTECGARLPSPSR